MAETRTSSATGAEKGVKPWQYDLIPPTALRELAIMYGVGASKYAEHNFRRGYEWSKSYAALQRHANLFWAGEDADLEMGLSHMTSVAWHTVAMLESWHVFPEYDNRNGKEIGTPTKFDYPEPLKIPHVNLDGGEGPEPRYDLMPTTPLALVSGVYAVKGRTGQQRWSSLYARMQDHVNLFWSGKDAAADGTHELALTLYYALELLDAIYNRTEMDDRFLIGSAKMPFDSAPAGKKPLA